MPEKLLETVCAPIRVGTTIPRGKKENILFIFRNKDNVKRREQGKKSDFTADCGAWDSKGSTKTCHYVYSNNMLKYVIAKGESYGVIIRNTWPPLNPQPMDSDIVILKRNYATSKRDSGFKRRITWFVRVPEMLKERAPNAEQLAIVEYVGNWPATASIHRNSKKSKNEYVRTAPETKEKVKKLVSTVQSRDIYQQLVLNDST
ncbi:hypothetical protein GQR58_011604 [Nymphon striatum]|nr:hypothetical protein GQR58_011604 [Nymphon striatum]